MVISALVEEGSPKRAFQAGFLNTTLKSTMRNGIGSFIVLSKSGQSTFGISRERSLSLNFIRSRENIGDLLDELKSERAYVAISSAIEEIYGGESPLDQDNAVEKAIELREILGDVLKLHAPHSDVLIKSDGKRITSTSEELMILRETGNQPGIPTGITALRSPLGRACKARQERLCSDGQEMRSLHACEICVEGAWAGYRMGFFSPEMTTHQHNCRFHTLLSAKREIQQAFGLRGAFRNRALKDGVGFNLKTYKRFLEYLDRR
jgi:hypothetical protein